MLRASARRDKRTELMGELFNVVWFHCNEQDLCPLLLLSSSELERERGKKMEIGFVVELFMLMRGSEFGAGHLT